MLIHSNLYVLNTVSWAEDWDFPSEVGFFLLSILIVLHGILYVIAKYMRHCEGGDNDKKSRLAPVIQLSDTVSEGAPRQHLLAQDPKYWTI